MLDTDGVVYLLDYNHCGEAHTAKVSNRLDDGRRATFPSSIKPHGRIRRADGSVTPGRRITVVHKSRIQRDEPFSSSGRPTHITRARYRILVPDLGSPTTPVRVRVKRRLRADFAQMTNYSQIQSLQVRETAAPYNLVVSLSNLEGEQIVDIAPGDYYLFVNEQSSYRATGPANQRGFMPPFLRSASITVEVPRH